MRLLQLLTSDRVKVGAAGSSKEEALRAVAALLARGDGTVDEQALFRVLEERERLASTGVGSGVAIPHGRLADLDQLRAAVLISPEGVPFDAIDDQPVQIIVGVLAPQAHTGDHLKVLARVSRLLRKEGVREQLVRSPDAEAALRLIAEEDERL